MEKIVKSSKILIGDISISYLIKEATEKNDKTILFIHGFPFNKDSWKPQLVALQNNVTGIAVDVRGHGLTTSGHGFFSIDVFARDLRVFIEKLELDHVILCGVSMGGYIALRAYELFPERITGLILSDTHHKADTNAAKQKRFDSIQAILQHGRRPFSIGFASNVFAETTVDEQPDLVEFIKNSIRKNTVHSICATLLALASRTDTTDILSKINVPTLIIRGAADKITPKDLMIDLHLAIAQSHYVEIENCGHLPNLENSSQFNALMNEFIENEIS
ncbi:MAG TPA: alpha/beta hydrolase [Sphingobacterium sp.]|nr:alpha/beta hydrolase [Sphingobacterium sp.]